VFPGLLGSAIVAGNVHAFSLWLAACINFMLYLLFTLAAAAIIRALLRRRHSHRDASTSDNLN
jgi:membrane protein implicated in regulation of membrane protease activity